MYLQYVQMIATRHLAFSQLSETSQSPHPPPPAPAPQMKGQITRQIAKYHDR